MNAKKIIAYIVAAITIVIGIFYIWAAFSPSTRSPFGNIVVGLISVGIGAGLIFWAERRPPSSNEVTYKIDLPANVDMDTIKCKSCGGTLSPKDISMVAGAPVVTCPYCKTTYQLTEDPKW